MPSRAGRIGFSFYECIMCSFILNPLNIDTINEPINIPEYLYPLKNVEINYDAPKLEILLENVFNDLVNDMSNLQNIVRYYGNAENKKFSDKEIYKKYREHDDLIQIKRFNPKSKSLLMIDKTFQKARIYNKAIIYNSNIFPSNFMIADSINTKYFLSEEYDISTAKVYGNKKKNRDGKTPEGLFTVMNIASSHDMLFRGKLMYGPYRMIISDKYPSIWIHGNGTDTTKHTSSNNRFALPEALGIFNNNIGYGNSHGCIRFDNHIIKRLIEEKIFQTGMQIIIYENKEMTKLLSINYPKQQSLTNHDLAYLKK